MPASKVVFALTSSGKDFFSAMTRVAVASLRISNPGLNILVACDRATDTAMREVDDPLRREADDWLAIDVPDGPAEIRNRHVKTILRLQLDGSFLFLDSDVFVRGDLNELFALDCDIAGAANHSHDSIAGQIWDNDRAMLKSMGWEIGDEVYLNGGVLLFNDTRKAHSLAAEWHHRWSESSRQENYHRDQPALNSALHAVRPNLRVLPHRFNAQIFKAPEVAVDAVIWHYYSSTRRPAMTTYDALVQNVLHSGHIDPEDVRRISQCPHPWIVDDLVDVWAEMAALKKENADLVRHLGSIERAHESLGRDFAKVLSSKSWRLTQPFRAIDALRLRLLSAPDSTTPDGASIK